MNNRWSTDLIKSFFTLIFIFLSYLISNKFNIISNLSIISNNLPEKAVFTMGVAVYTAILNFLLFSFLSYRSRILVRVLDKKDKSDRIKILEKPRSIVVEIEINDTSINKGKVTIKFPEWIDVMKSNDPAIKTITPHTFDYLFEERTNKLSVHFDINLNILYLNSEREGEISADFHGNRIKYGTTIKNLKIHNK